MKCLAKRYVVIVTLAGLAWGAPAAEAPPLPWSFPAASPLRLLVVRGLWHEHYQLDAAAARAGGALLTDLWVWDGTGSGWPGPGDQGGGGISAFPAPAGLMAHHVVIVANTNARALGAHQRDLVEYVRQGGAALFLGGRFAFGKQYADSPLAALCPVTFPGAGPWQSDLQATPAGLVVAPAATPGPLAAALAALPWAQQPRVYWHHRVQPRAGATVALTAGDAPLLVLGTCERGRVALFAGTVMGEPAAGQVPLWAWDGWPPLLAAVLTWLAEAPVAAPHGLPADVRATMQAELTRLGGADLEGKVADDPALPQLLAALTARCQDAASVRWLLERVAALRVDLPPDLPVALAAQARAWPGPDLAALATPAPPRHSAR